MLRDRAVAVVSHQADRLMIGEAEVVDEAAFLLLEALAGIELQRRRRRLDRDWPRAGRP